MSANTNENSNNIHAHDITKETLNRQFHLGASVPQKASISEADVTKLQQLLKDFYLPFFKENRKKLLITNENPKIRNTAFYYCTITKEAILYEVKSDVKKDSTLYDFNTDEVFHNKEKKDGNFLSEFVDKLEKMSADIRNNKAEVYEEFNK